MVIPSPEVVAVAAAAVVLLWVRPNGARSDDTERANRHFLWREIDPTRKGRANPVTRARLQRRLDEAADLRDRIGKPLAISAHGGFEPPEGFPDGWRRKNEGSRHKLGLASDFKTPAGMTVQAFHLALRDDHKRTGGGLGLYSWGGHRDNGPTRAAWGSEKPESEA